MEDGVGWRVLRFEREREEACCRVRASVSLLEEATDLEQENVIAADSLPVRA